MAAIAVAEPEMAERRIPRAAPPIATATPARGLARPLGIGLRGFYRASCGASTTSLSAPIEHWIASMASPRRAVVGTEASASVAIPAVADALSSDGNGWTSRTRPRRRCREPSRGGRAPSDVHELLEVRDEVLDQTGAAVGDEAAHARNERPEADRGDHDSPLAIASQGRRRSATESERAFEFGFAELRGAPEVGDDLHDPPPLDDVAHELGDPAVDLFVGLVGEPRAIFLRVG